MYVVLNCKPEKRGIDEFFRNPKTKIMKKILLMTVFAFFLLVPGNLAWTGTRVFSTGLLGFNLSEPASLLMLGVALLCFSLYLKRVIRKSAGSSR
jgi:hypothetical protein